MPHTFLDRAYARIERSIDCAQALRRARFLGDLCWKNSIGCYQLGAVETLLMNRYGDRFCTSLPAPQTPHIAYLHVLTQAYDTGGHTKVVERLLMSTAMHDAAVLVTEHTASKAHARLSTAQHGVCVLPARLAPTERVQRILEQCAQARTVVLHIHPYDIETAFAAHLAKRLHGTQILFYNHADHVCSYGYACADRILEISHFGWALNVRRGVREKAHFVGIPLKLSATSPVTRDDVPPAHPYLASSGLAYKFKPGQGWSFPHVAQQLVRSSGLSMVLVGPRPLLDWWWWPVRLRLGRRLRFTGMLNYPDYLDCIGRASAYIDSFPMTGGTSFTEILCLGVPAFGILTGAHGYSPADQIKSTTPAAMIDAVLAFLRDPEPLRAGMSRLHAALLHAHDLEAVAQRIVQAQQADIPTPPPWENPAPADTHFYEALWRTRRGFGLPIHGRPDVGIACAFLHLWWRTRHDRR